MSEEWAKSETNTGIPYYINHITERTQWDHPDLVRYLQVIENMNNIRFAAYRTAMKLRTLQKLLHLDVVDLSTIDSAFEQHGFRFYNDTVMDAVQLYNIIYEVYFLTKSKGRSSLNVNSSSDLLHNWILNLYDTSRTGCLRVLSVKIGIVVLCASRITDKYKYLYQQVTDRAGGVSQKNITALLQDIMQFAELIGESGAFGKNVHAAVNSCFQTVLGSTITKERFMEWFMAEPQTIVWLPTMHRLATAETMKHEVKCNICKMYPIIGLRYKCLKCLNYDLCQECFFTGRSTKNHKYTHPTQEYCLGASSKEDVRAFAKTVRNKLSKKHGRRIKQKYLAIGDGGADLDTSSRRSEPIEADTHMKMGQLSKRLAAIENMQPDGAFVALPGGGPTDGIRPSGIGQEHDDDAVELDDLIDQLEQENEDLLNEMENLRLERSRLPRHIRDSGSDSSDDDGISGGVRRPPGPSDEALRQQHEMMKARQEVLEENNRELEQQMQQLKEIMKKKYLSQQVRDSPTAAQFGHRGAPPPYGSPRPNPHTMNRGDPFGLSGFGSSLVTPPTIAYHSNNEVNNFDVQSPLTRSNLQHSIPVMPSQSPRGLDLIDSHQAPPSSVATSGIDQSRRGTDLIDSRHNPSSLFPTPSGRGENQSLATSALIDRNMLLPPHLSDQSELRFPNLGVSRAHPTEEEELDDLLQKLDDAYPVNFTYNNDLSSQEPSPSNRNAIPSMQLAPSPQGRRGGHPQDMLTAAARVGQAMSTLVSRVATTDVL